MRAIEFSVQHPTSSGTSLMEVLDSPKRRVCNLLHFLVMLSG